MTTCAACADRRYIEVVSPLAAEPILYQLDLSLDRRAELRRCWSCGRAFFAVPESEWIEVQRLADQP